MGWVVACFTGGMAGNSKTNLRGMGRTVGIPLITLAGAGLCGLEARAGVVAIVLLSVVLFAYARPKNAIACWLIFTIFAPFWIQVNVPGLPPVYPAYLGPLILCGAIVSPKTTVRLNRLDIPVIFGGLLIVAGQQIFGLATFLVSNGIVWLVCAYVLGRLADLSITKLYTICMLIVAAWGIVEFALGLHVFAELQYRAGAIGPNLQERAGLTRSEA